MERESLLTYCQVGVALFISPHTLTSEVTAGHVAAVTARSNASWQTDRETLTCGKDWKAWEVKLPGCSAAERLAEKV